MSRIENQNDSLCESVSSKTGPSTGSKVKMNESMLTNRSDLQTSLRLVVSVLMVVLFAGIANAAGGGDDHDPTMEAIWQGVNLAILLGVIFHFGRGPISAFFSGRRSGIQSELSEAAELLSKAEQRNAKLQRRLVDLSIEVDGIREATTRRAGEEADRILSDARATAERIRTDAQAAVDQELRRARTELRKEAANLALEIAARKLTDNVSDNDRDRLLDEFITRVEPAKAEGANQ